MERRLKLQMELSKILNSDHVYFNPPETIKLQYPCIIFKKKGANLKKADNRVYRKTSQYQLIYIRDKNDELMENKLLDAFPMISEGVSYTSQNLLHTPYTLFY